MVFSYSKINFEHIRKIAYHGLALLGVKTFPIRVIPLFKKFSKVKLISYTEAADKEGITINELINKVTHSDDAATLERDDKYFVFYNDDTLKIPVERIRYSIIHELGHIVLGHFKDDRTLLTRSFMSKKEYKRLEIEANFFAAEFLSPKALISADWKLQEIQSVFRVSGPSANRTHKFLSKNPWFQNRSYSEFTNKQCDFYFSKPLDILLPPCCTLGQAFSTVGFAFCANCQSFTRIGRHQSTVFCCICGKKLKNTLFDKNHLFTIYDLEIRQLKQYTSINLNNSGKALECPKCHAIQNEEGEFCDVCGSYLINRCTGHQSNDIFYNDGFGTPCDKGHILGGRSRYCRYCGATSTFYEQDLLPSYSKDTLDSNSSSSHTTNAM